MFEAFKSVRKERAGIERDRLYLESMAADDMIENYMNLIPGSMMEDETRCDWYHRSYP